MLDLQVLAPERAPCLSALNPGLWDRGAGRAELLWGVTSFTPVLSSVSAAAAPCRCWSGRSRARPCTCSRIRIPLPAPPQGQARAGTRTAINQQSPQHHPKPNLWLCSFPISSSALYPAPEPRAWPGSSWIWEHGGSSSPCPLEVQSSLSVPRIPGLFCPRPLQGQAGVSHGSVWGNTWEIPDLLVLVAAERRQRKGSVRNPQGSWGEFLGGRSVPPFREIKEKANSAGRTGPCRSDPVQEVNARGRVCEPWLIPELPLDFAPSASGTEGVSPTALSSANTPCHHFPPAKVNWEHPFAS